MHNNEDLLAFVKETYRNFSEKRAALKPAVRFEETGIVKSIQSGVVKVSGLPGVGYQELVQFPGNNYGIAFNLDETETGVVLLSDETGLKAGEPVRRTGRTLDIPVGDGLLGRVVDPLGMPLDGKGPVSSSMRFAVERPAPAIMDRSPVNSPLQTGIKVIDALIPIGKGQRELILGDRQTGKTAIGIDTILSQRDKNVICVYCAIGQRSASVAGSIARLEAAGAMEYSIVMVTEGSDPSGLQYIAPYAATSMAEYFMEQGKDVLIVYDDLTKHARAYREMSLLLERPPGREAFPGDIFYLHSRLLERSTHLSESLGGGSLTALPIVETEAQNMSAYIPTNLISITDGQLYLSPTLFGLGILPAIDVGKSVSRVGGKAQWKIYRKVAGRLKLTYAQFEELETFARFGARLDNDTRKRIGHGKRIRQCLVQAEASPLSVAEQVMVLLALKNNLLDSILESEIHYAQELLCREAARIPKAIRQRMYDSGDITGEEESALLELAVKVLRQFDTTEAQT